jgi:small toxic polypeptide LdrA/B/C/D
MTYAMLDLIFLAAALAVAGVAAAGTPRRRRARSSALIPAIGITVAITLVLTAVFDNLMIALGLFSYEPGLLLGVRLGLVPVEDFAYPIAAAILLPSLWIVLGRRPGGTS